MCIPYLVNTTTLRQKQSKNELYDWANDNRDEYTLLLGNILHAKRWSFGSWVVNLKLKSKPADEGALYCINRMYHRHTIVYHKSGFWSTVSPNKPRHEVSKLCDVHLLLLGDLKYGEIRPILTGDQNTNHINWEEFESWFTKSCRNNQPPAPIPLSIRGKRSAAMPINYYDMNCGRNASQNNKRRKSRNQDEPSKLSAPSPARLAAQQHILDKKSKYPNPDIMIINELPADTDGQPFVRPSAQHPVKCETKLEVKKEIKLEDETRNTRHQYKGKELDWRTVNYIHKDGSICNKERILKEQRMRDEEMQLPDLPSPNNLISLNTTQKIPTSESANGLRVETDLVPTTTVYGESISTNTPPNTTNISADVNSLHVETNLPETSTTAQEVPVMTSATSKMSVELTLSTSNTETDSGVNYGSENNQPTTELNEISLHDETTDDPQFPITQTQPTSLTENIISLPVETSDPPADGKVNASDIDLIDKYDAAEGLLLLGTDVSSADDSQLANDIGDRTDINIDSDSNKTIVHSSPPVKTVQTPPTVKSPRKGVLNFRQIGIKRHQPVDSSDPSAIGLPPGSPETRASATKAKKRRKNRVTATQTKDVPKPKDSNKHQSTNKGNLSKPINYKRTNKSSETFPARRPKNSSMQQDSDGKYSIKRITVTGTTYYCCSYCEWKFNSLHGLNNHHEKKHPPVQCDVCNRTFTTPNSLIHHSYTHLDRSFNCEHCEKSFPFKSQLDNHLTVHTQTIKHKCENCGKEFVRTGEYNIHMRGHANILLKCPVKGCDYANTDKRNLNSHRKSHSKKISVFCKICGKGFVYHEQRK